MTVADTSAIVALINADDAHHEVVRAAWEADDGDWVLPWAILPEVDYLLGKYLGAPVQRAFHQDLAEGAWPIEAGVPADFVRARELDLRYPGLEMGLVDGVVAAIAERLRASAIATLDVRHFGALSLSTSPRLIPRDL